MSPSLPKGKRNAPVTSEKTLDGHVCDAWGISSSMASGGRMMWKPLTKYSWQLHVSQAQAQPDRAPTAINIDPRREKQKPSSDQREPNAGGRCRPRSSTSILAFGEVDPALCSVSEVPILRRFDSNSFDGTIQEKP